MGGGGCLGGEGGRRARRWYDPVHLLAAARTTSEGSCCTACMRAARTSDESILARTVAHSARTYSFGSDVSASSRGAIAVPPIAPRILAASARARKSGECCNTATTSASRCALAVALVRRVATIATAATPNTLEEARCLRAATLDGSVRWISAANGGRSSSRPGPAFSTAARFADLADEGDSP